MVSLDTRHLFGGVFPQRENEQRGLKKGGQGPECTMGPRSTPSCLLPTLVPFLECPATPPPRLQSTSTTDLLVLEDLGRLQDSLHC